MPTIGGHSTPGVFVCVFVHGMSEERDKRKEMKLNTNQRRHGGN